MYQILIDLNQQLELEAKLFDAKNDLKKGGFSLIEIIDGLSRNDLKYLKQLLSGGSWNNVDWDKLAKRGKNSNVSRALVEAVNLQYDTDKDNLKEMEKKLEEYEQQYERYHAWDNAIKKGTYKLLHLAYKIFEEERKRYNSALGESEKDIASVEDAISEISWYIRYWEFFRSGTIPLSWFLILVLALGVAISVKLLFKEIQVFLVFFAPFVGTVFALWSRYWDGVKKVNMVIKDIAETSEKASLQEVDIEIGQGPLGSSLAFKAMKELKGEIRMIKDRNWIADGECLVQVVHDRLRSGGYGDKLGVIHKAQGDLQRLSDTLRSRSTEKILPRGDPRVVLLLTTLIGVHRTRL
jgi:hypothetical protein